MQSHASLLASIAVLVMLLNTSASTQGQSDGEAKRRLVAELTEGRGTALTLDVTFYGAPPEPDEAEEALRKFLEASTVRHPGGDIVAKAWFRMSGDSTARQAVALARGAKSLLYVAKEKAIRSVGDDTAPSGDWATGTSDDVKYTVIESDTFRRKKRSLSVRLSGKVSEDALRSIAMELKNRDAKHYERTFIVYYLPGMRVNAGAWATTHFNPNLEVKILRMTLEDELRLLKEQPQDISRDVIAIGLDERWFDPLKSTIYRKGGKVFLELSVKGDAVPPKELVEKRSGARTRFQLKEPVNDFGEYYLIDSRGNAQIWDRDGFIVALRRVD